MNAWIFPGQGSQSAGMAEGLSGRQAIETFATAASILGWDVRAVCLSGSDEYLRTTEVVQPALLTVCTAAARTLEAKGARPDAVAGHSVGDFAALVAAGSLSFEDALGAVVARAEGMARAGREHPGGMAAVLGLELGVIEDVCERSGEVVVANVNAPGQVVISGEREALDRAAAAAKEAGARRVIPLNVSVAAHSPLMAPAVGPLEAVLRSVAFDKPSVPFFSAFTGESHDDPAELPSLLAGGVTERVRWIDCVRALEDRGVRRFIEVGPGEVLSGLVRRISPDAERRNVSSDTEADALREEERADAVR